MFGGGSTFGKCKRTPHWKGHALMPHMKLQLDQFTEGMGDSALDFKLPPGYEANASYYLWARDEDAHNVFHAHTDFMTHFMGR